MGDFEVRDRREPHGPRRPAREREAYLRLLDQEVSYAEACRIGGITTWTGKRWRNGRNASGRNKAAPPANAVVPPR